MIMIVSVRVSLIESIGLLMMNISQLRDTEVELEGAFDILDVYCGTVTYG